MQDSRIRSLTKAVTYRGIVFLAVLIGVFLYSGDVSMALGVAFIDFLVKTLLYYVHERFWDKFQWGKDEP